METLKQDLSYAFRTLFRKPGFALSAVLSLALGIGANTMIFTVVNAAFLAPLPVREQDRLVAVFTNDVTYPGHLPVSYPNFEEFRDHNEVVSNLVAVQFLSMNLSGGEVPERVFGQMVSGGYFDLLGVRAALGRTFLPEDDGAPGKSPVLVMSHGLWQRRYGSDPKLVGSKIRLNGQEFTVIGVTPRGFSGTDRITASDVWVPMSMYTQVSRFRDSFQDRSFRMFDMVGRLKPGVSVSQADAAFRTLGKRLEQSYPDANKGLGATAMPLSEASLDIANRHLYVRGSLFLTIVVGLLLLITCANLASLLLARAETRRREMGIRLAIGAGRGRLIRQLLTESLVLSLLGGAAALFVSYLGSKAIWRLRPPFLTDNTPLVLSLDGRVLAFTLLVSLLTGVLFGLAPALRSARTDLAAMLGVNAPVRGGRRKLGVLDALAAVQVGLALVSLVGAGLFLRSLGNVHRIDVGFKADELAVLSFDVTTLGYDEARGRQLYRRVLERASAVPGVDAATLGSHRPLSRVGVLLPVRAEGQDLTERAASVRADTVGLGYFETLGIPILKGRGFEPFDREGSSRVAIVNETMAGHYWPGQDAVGKRFQFGESEDFVQVVGVARDSKYVDVGEPPQSYFYLPLEQNYAPTMTLWVRTAHPDNLVEPVRREVQALAPDLPLTDVQTAMDRLNGSLWAPRLGASLLTGFGALALALASIGIYGVTAYAVTQRRREIGIRLALGSQRGEILGMVIRQALVMIGLGMALGVAMALSGGKLVSSMLFGVSPTDLTTLALVCAFFAAVAFVASFLPANRATRTDVLKVLRTD
ncbi:MAG: ABC transporter permease [Acidobacteriota bacterium]